jgi:hypothetical protein
MHIKEKWFVDLDTQIAKREKPGNKKTQLSVHFDSTKKYLIWLKFRIVDTNLKNHIYCKMTLSEECYKETTLNVLYRTDVIPDLFTVCSRQDTLSSLYIVRFSD